MAKKPSTKRPLLSPGERRPQWVSTVQLARMLGLPRRQILTMISNGTLHGHRHSATAARRVSVRSAVRWCLREGIDAAELFRMADAGAVAPLVYVVTVDHEIAGAIKGLGAKVHEAQNVIEAGILLTERIYSAYVIDAAIGRDLAVFLARRLQASRIRHVYGIVSEDDGTTAKQWAADGFRRVYRHPVNAESVAREVVEGV
jgi:hypothetical protein